MNARSAPSSACGCSSDMKCAMAQPQALLDPQDMHHGPLEGTEARSHHSWVIDELRLHHIVVAAFPAQDTLAGGTHVAVPIGALAPRHRHNKALAGRSHDDGGAIGFARAATLVLDHAIQR